MKKRFIMVVAAICTFVFVFSAYAGTRGVTDDMIILGAHSDLSGPLASWGVASVNGIKLRFKEVNQDGGIHGRKIKFLVEDTRYQVPLAVKATRKLIVRDKIFAMVGGLGTSQNNAAMKIQFKSNVPNLFPLSGAEVMGIPFKRLKFGYLTNYKKQIRAGIRYFVETQGIKSVCLQRVLSDAGQEFADGFNQAVKTHGLEVKLVGGHKTTETEFVGAGTKIKNSGCDLLVLGTAVKDTIIIHATLKKLGWKKPIMTAMVPYMPLVAKAAQGAMNGLYSIVPIFNVTATGESAASRKFIADYRAAYNAEPNNQAQTGYIFADLTAKALQRAGRDLTVDSLIKALEGIKNYVDPFGTSSATYGPKAHFGGNRVSLVQVRDQKWVIVKESIPF